MNISIKEVWEQAHQGYLQSVDLRRSFEGIRRKSEKLVKSVMTSSNNCKKKKNSK